MSALKLTKTELRDQQFKLTQLQKYLPTLQLKKAMLQAEITQAVVELESYQSSYEDVSSSLDKMGYLFADYRLKQLLDVVKVEQISTTTENIAGVEIPKLVGITFSKSGYLLFDTPAWFDSAVAKIKELVTAREKIKIAEAKKRALEKELREVSIRVNLFEKVMIPRCRENIKKIKIYLGDLQLSEVSRAKVSKKKIVQRHQKQEEEETA